MGHIDSPVRWTSDFDWAVKQRDNMFRVHTKAYTDQEVLDAEFERIFNRTWIYVAHTSEIANPGDFKTSHIGAQPVIVVRSRDDEINVLINRCVHRGSVVCREPHGNARQFVCAYHGWAYNLTGKLAGIPDRNRPGGYADSFEAPEGLFKAPRVEIYRGFIFANLDPNAGPLLDHLGRARQLIDQKLDLSPVGEIKIRSRPYVVRYKGNWKFQAENIVDGYHFMYVHQPFVRLMEKYRDSTGDFGVHEIGTQAEVREIRYTGEIWGCAQGHGVVFQPENNLDKLFKGRFGDIYKALRHKVDEATLARIGGKGAGCIFPNLGMIHHQVRVWRPISPELTEVAIYPYELVGLPDHLNAGMLRSQERFYGPAGHGMPDDVDIFMQNSEGLRGSAVEWLILERGLESDAETDNGDARGLPSSEVTQRGFWRAWLRAMKAEGARQ